MELVGAYLHLRGQLSAFEMLIHRLKILVNGRTGRISIWISALLLGQADHIVHFWLVVSIRIVSGAGDMVRSCSRAQQWVGLLVESFEGWVDCWLCPWMTPKITVSVIQLVLWSIVHVLWWFPHQFLAVVGREDSVAAGSHMLGTWKLAGTLNIFHLHQLADVVVGLVQRPHRMCKLGKIFFNISGQLLSFLGCCNRVLGRLCNHLRGLVMNLDKLVWNKFSAWLCWLAPLFLGRCSRSFICLPISECRNRWWWGAFQLLLLCYLFDFRMVHELELIGVHSVLDIAVQAVVLVAVVVVPVSRIFRSCAKVFGVCPSVLRWDFRRFHELEILTWWVLGSDGSRFGHIIHGPLVGLRLLLFFDFGIYYCFDLHVFRVAEKPKFGRRRLVCADMGHAQCCTTSSVILWLLLSGTCAPQPSFKLSTSAKPCLLPPLVDPIWKSFGSRHLLHSQTIMSSYPGLNGVWSCHDLPPFWDSCIVAKPSVAWVRLSDLLRQGSYDQRPHSLRLR